MAARKQQDDSPPSRRQRGFEPAAQLLSQRIRVVGESRGFAVSRLLTGWAEIAGPDLAPVTRPVKVSYGREGGLGASLTLLVAPAHAPLVQMQLPQLKDRVNAAYGYAAIARITLTQTAATGFAEGQAQFAPAPKAAAPAPDPQVAQAAAGVAAPIRDQGLRTALEALAQNVLTRAKSKEGRTK